MRTERVFAQDQNHFFYGTEMKSKQTDISTIGSAEKQHTAANRALKLSESKHCSIFSLWPGRWKIRSLPGVNCFLVR